MANEVATSGAGTTGLNDNEKMLSAVGYVHICCYAPLFLIPMFGAKDSRFAKFHAKQAAALYIVAVVGMILYWVMWTVLGVIGNMIGFHYLSCLATIFGLVVGGTCFVLMIIGAINAMQAQEKELPLLGPLAAKLPI